MNKTKAQKYNERLEKIFNPEIERLKRREEISKEIIKELEKRVDIDYCGCEMWVIINTIGKVMDKFIK
jgi:hypothetical protein